MNEAGTAVMEGGVSAGAGPTFKLSEAEVTVLRDDAEAAMLRQAGERLRSYHPDRCGGSPDEARASASEEMVAAAEVYGALRNVELKFSDLGTGRETPESVEVQFTERAEAWLRELRDGIRGSLEERRGSVEIDIDSTPTETFLLFVLDGIVGGES